MGKKAATKVTKLNPDKKTTLSMWDRVTLQTILPQESSFEGKIALNDLRKTLSFTQEDVKKFKIKTTDANAITWSNEAAKKLFDFFFSELEFTQLKLAISSALTKLDAEKKVSDGWILLAAKFDAKPFEKAKDK